MFYLVLATVIVLITLVDFFYTTISFNGAGFLNKRVTGWFSSFFLYINKHSSSREPLRLSGLSQVLFSLGIWICLLWLGLLLLLLSSDSSIVNAQTLEPAGFVNKFYFSGFVLSTLGMGDYIPVGPVWQVVVTIFSFSGFIFITTGISYLLNLTSAVLQKRDLALFISNLGEKPEEILVNTYGNGDFSRLIKYSSTLQEKINKHNQNHYAYPLSHYFYSISRSESFAINVVNLDEALTIILHQVNLNDTVQKDLIPLRDALSKFLAMVEKSEVANFAEHIGSPDLYHLEEVDKPEARLCEEERAAINSRRALLLGFLKSSGWSWNDIYSCTSSES